MVLLIWLKLIYLIISALAIGLLYRKQFSEVFKLFGWNILLAGVALGLTTSIRILGPLVGTLSSRFTHGKRRTKNHCRCFLYMRASRWL